MNTYLTALPFSYCITFDSYIHIYVAINYKYAAKAAYFISCITNTYIYRCIYIVFYRII